MNSFSTYRLYVLPLLVLCLFSLGYIFLIRPAIPMAFEDNAPAWFNTVIELFYPRFYIEKHRFDLSFFLEKGDQVILRFSLITLTAIIFAFCYDKYALKNYIKIHFTQAKTSVRNVQILNIFTNLLILYFGLDLAEYVISLASLREFYKPVFFLKLLNLPYPSVAMLYIISAGMAIACLLSIFRIVPALASGVAVLLFILLQNLSYSFEKVDHGFATLTYAALLMPFLLRDHVIARRKGSKEQDAWALKLIMITIALVYLMSGLEKLFISHFSWATAETFKAYIMLHNIPLGVMISGSPFLSTVLPVLALLFQLGFISILFFKKLRWFFLPAGILFHLGTYFMFGAGAVFNPWWMVYVFFIDWKSEK
ncbi:MAG: hypothetical protein ACK4ND_15075 [Cytophagaceae bacterium]